MQKGGETSHSYFRCVDEESRDLLAPMFHELHAITDGTVSSQESIEHASHYLRAKTKQVMENYLNNLKKRGIGMLFTVIALSVVSRCVHSCFRVHQFYYYFGRIFVGIASGMRLPTLVEM